MLVVREVYAKGHDELTPAHLGYICHMANRVGFSVAEDAISTCPSVALIKLNISMKNPFFTALVEDLKPICQDDELPAIGTKPGRH